jgi:hypothetical protein
MKCIHYFIILCTAVSIKSFAQEAQEAQEEKAILSISELENSLEDKKVSDKDRTNTLLTLGDYYLEEPNEKAVKYINEALAISKVLKDSFDIIRAYNRLAQREIFEENDLNVIKYVDSALSYANRTKQKHFAGIGFSYRLKGMAYNFLERNDLSLGSLLQANRFLLKDNQDLETRTYLAENYGDLAFIYFTTDNKETALACIEKSLSIGKPIEAWREVGDAYEFLAGFYYDDELYETAKKYLDSATVMFQRAGNVDGLNPLQKSRAEILLKENLANAASTIYKEQLAFDKKDAIPYILTNDYIFLSEASIKLGNIEVARKYLDSARVQAIISENPAHIFTIAGQKAKILKAENNLPRAITELNKILNHPETEDFIESEKEVVKQLYELYEDNNQPKLAFEFLMRHNKLEDSLRTVLQKNKFNVIQSEFNYNEISSKLEARDAQLKVSEAEQQRAKDRTYFIIGMFILLMGFFVFSYFRQRKIAAIKRETLLAKQETMTVKQESLDNQVKFKNKQITDFAIHISEKNDLLENIKAKMKGIRVINDAHKSVVMDTIQFINNDIDQNKEKIQLYQQVNETNDSFRAKIDELYKNLNEKEKKVATMLRLGQTSKQIALQLGISAASVDNYRYNLRKKMEIPKGESLKNFIKSI